VASNNSHFAAPRVARLNGARRTAMHGAYSIVAGSE